MKPGDSVNCPHCGQDVFLVKKTLMDGWAKLGDMLSCSACTEKIADIEADNPIESANNKSESANKLAIFLDTEKESAPALAADDSEKLFCRDCNHLVQHPFLIRCNLHQKDVNPMADCPDFMPKISEDDE